DVADLPDRRHAILRNLASLAGRQLHQRVFFFLRDQLRRPTRRPHHLSTLARLQFQVVDLRAWRNIPQWQGIADQNVSLWTADYLLSHLQPFRLNNVALLAIRVREQSNAGRAVRIVLDGCHSRWNPGLIALEIDTAQ